MRCRNQAMEILTFLHRRIEGSELELESKGDANLTLLLDDIWKITYQPWGNTDDYLILWRRNKYTFELDLTRVQKTDTSNIIWYLGRPTRKENQEVLSQLSLDYVNLPEGYRKAAIQSRKMGSRKDSVRIDTKGYLLVEDADRETAYHLLYRIITTIMTVKQIAENRDPNSGGDARGIEGQAQENRYLGYKRNKKIVELRKANDKYTCQACTFKFSHKGRSVIECHHINPLRGETITTIDDLVCLCPNCHRIAHTENPPLSVSNIRRLRS